MCCNLSARSSNSSCTHPGKTFAALALDDLANSGLRDGPDSQRVHRHGPDLGYEIPNLTSVNETGGNRVLVQQPAWRPDPRQLPA